MEFNLEDFVEQPTLNKLHTCTKDNLLAIADHFCVTLLKQAKKEVVKSELVTALTDKGVFPCETTVVAETSSAGRTDPTVQLRLKELDIEMRRLAIKEKELDYELQSRKIEADKQIRLKELDLKGPDFDVNKCVRLVPPFSEQDVDKYFTLFERVAETLKWPKTIWPLLLQSVFTGKAQDAYTSMSPESSLEYEKVKSAVLRAYELVPEAYRQKFRRLKKTDDLTYQEFGRNKEIMFDRWCRATSVADFVSLRNLILLEEFKNCLPDRIATYVNEQKASTVSDTAVLADEYVLTHRYNFERPHLSAERSAPVANPFVFPIKSHLQDEAKPPNKESADTKDRPICFYCKKRGHTISQCFALEKQNKSPKAVNLLKTEFSPKIQFGPKQPILVESNLDVYAPFLMKGTVSLSEQSSKIPVTILRDSAASQSVILEGVLPFSDTSSTNTKVLVRGFGMQYVGVPLHTVHLDSKLVKGPVVVGVSPQFPISGVSFILGNDLAGGKVLLNPEVTAVPLSGHSDDLSQRFPEVFTVCAVTRAMRAGQKRCLTGGNGEVEAADILRAKSDCPDPAPLVPPPTPSTPVVTPEAPTVFSPAKDLSVKVEMSREQLIIDQKDDSSLALCFDAIVPAGEVEKLPTCYFLRDGVLVRKWMPRYASLQDDWGTLTQVVVPKPRRQEILVLAHDNPLAGHLGVNKTYDRILRCFFWPGLKRDVRQYCKTCHVCQVAGKPNQTIPPFPLYPIPVVTQPFERVIVDCVGPLPRTKAGNKFLLTIMCSATRFPEAVPLRKITTKTVVKALLKFFSMFGLPKIVQTDQGSNFMSRIFAQVLKQLDITHYYSSAYHPESQGAIERFHQTLKSMLRTYCIESNKDWDEGVHLLLFAAREVVQESLGFSPAELVFAHTVRGPLKLLQEKWLGGDEQKNLCDYVSDFRSRLHHACELAKENMSVAQTKMKTWFDVGAKSRSFNPGDKVLMLSPIHGSTLQASYSGPYLVREKVNDRDYIITTPEHRRKSRLCHINMLKPYLDRESVPVNTDEKVVVSLSSVEVINEAQGTGVLSGADSPEALVAPAVSDDEDITGPSAVMVQGRLKNFEMLSKLDVCLPHLTQAQHEDVVSLIKSHLSLFSDVPTRTNVLQHDIDVGDSPPIKQHPYRVNPNKRLRLQQQVTYMLENGIAEPSSSSWSSPCLLADKSDGSDRFCTDFRKVNGVTKPDCYPLPRVEDCVDHVGNATYVTKLDLLKGYWQVPLTPRAREISAFVTPGAFLQYTVMPFGVRNAPATFQRLVNIVLSGLSGCEAYLDDIVIYSNSWHEHIRQLKAVFTRLCDANLTLNLAKCEFGRATVEYLGKVVGQGQVKPVNSKIEAIRSFPAPGSRRELRRFLGMAGYYRCFCNNFSAVAAPLTDLLSPKTRFHWSESCQRAFDCVKALLAHAPVLAAPAFDRPFKLAVDASDAGAGAVLLQDGDDDVEHPVSYFSKKFNKHQRVYSTIEKEALALVLALKHFEVYVGSASAPVVVYTDHNPLVFINQMRNTNHRLMRWALFLQSFNIMIRHVKGRENVVADALSRCYGL
uniref:Gypsy retrotransposon integrase-like protein 1 n=1 Tax=Sparus aurata TaxID=8175 RepID=A0A671UEB7_SPAAU